MAGTGATAAVTRVTVGPATPAAPRGLGPRVSGLYLALYLHYGFFALLPLWLRATGATAGEIGTLMALPLLLRVLTVAPVAGWLGRRGLVRDAILGMTIATALAALPLLGRPAGIARYAAIVGFALLWDQLPVLVDAYAVMAVRAAGLDFGRLRVWGSIALVASAAAAGATIGVTGILWLPAIIAALLILPALVAIALPRDARLMREPPGAGGGWRELFADRALIGAIAAASLVMGSHGVLQSFGAIQWQAQGLSVTAIGLLNAVAVASEIGAFVVGQRLLGGRDPRWLLALAAAAAAVRWGIMATAPALPLLVAAQLLQGLTASGAILAPALLIAARVPNRLASAAQGLNAVALGLVLAGVTAVAGLLWNLGIATAYLAMVVLALLPVPALLRGMARREAFSRSVSWTSGNRRAGRRPEPGGSRSDNDLQ